MNQQESLEFLQQCMDEIKNWMPEDFLYMKNFFSKISHIWYVGKIKRKEKKTWKRKIMLLHM